MIRKAQPADYEKLTRLWLESSLLAHAFIDAAYWEKMQSTVRDYYLPNTETYVFEDRHRIKGFISLCENNYIGALFIAPQHQNQRIGTKLLEYSRRKRPNLTPYHTPCRIFRHIYETFPQAYTPAFRGI